MIRNWIKWGLDGLEQRLSTSVSRTGGSYFLSNPGARRYWHDMTNPDQLDRFCEAEAKREAREAKRQRRAYLAWCANRAHRQSPNFEALNPLYVSNCINN